MQKGLLDFNWDYIQGYSEEDITYFLFLEGKTMEAISRIRNIDKALVQKHIINGKINYRYFIKNESIGEFLQALSLTDKHDRNSIIHNLNIVIEKKLLKYINDNYASLSPLEKERAVWIIGELKDIDSLNVLVKASVHKSTNIRRMAISAMNKISDMKCEDHLIRTLYDDNPQVVLYALKALENLKSKKAFSHIEKLEKQWKKEYLIKEKEIYISKVFSEGVEQ
ncbi:HEAT repeat domain-containing protein [Clostridium grantii]|uniref:HEAT repeat-containing protein n=1 Tax=Clostridium grantii DSM 8605 TaxID=1121316 RepID=A0A1M5SKL4_9CLOT|nr:HEAT repeat domain-containing protein [Clostridium grantii]SHH39076.1 HEAT repeat-containing protein [Clostridium grantii DSM 8605]